MGHQKNKQSDSIYDVPGAHQYYRLQRLQRLYDAAVLDRDKFGQQLALQDMRRELVSGTAKKVIFIMRRFYNEMPIEGLKEEISLMTAELKKRGIDLDSESKSHA